MNPNLAKEFKKKKDVVLLTVFGLFYKSSDQKFIKKKKKKPKTVELLSLILTFWGKNTSPVTNYERLNSTPSSFSVISSSSVLWWVGEYEDWIFSKSCFLILYEVT